MADNDYSGDMILINRLSEFFPNHFGWNEGEIISLSDISKAVLDMQSEENEPFGNGTTDSFIDIKSKSTKWHIGRVLYFINHPDEIVNIDVDNLCAGLDILPIPIITDGNHRFVAAIYLHSQGKMNMVHCRYGGRIDLLNYFRGDSECCPED